MPKKSAARMENKMKIRFADITFAFQHVCVGGYGGNTALLNRKTGEIHDRSDFAGYDEIPEATHPGHGPERKGPNLHKNPPFTTPLAVNPLSRTTSRGECPNSQKSGFLSITPSAGHAASASG